MTSPVKIAANRANAARSTGPRTPAGKATSALNRLAHGLRAAVVTIPGEDPAAWEAFRRGVVDSLAPDNPLEAELAHRAAAGLWRLRRCDALEALWAEAATAAAHGDPDFQSALDERKAEGRAGAARRLLDDEREGFACFDRPSALARLPALPDHAAVPAGEVQFMVCEVTLGMDDSELDLADADFLAAHGVPPEGARDPWGWDGWTAGLARAVCRAVADWHGADLAERAADAARALRAFRARGRVSLRAAEARLEEQEGTIEAIRLQRLLEAVGPDDRWEATLARYEAHHLRAVRHALEALARVRASRPE